MKFRLALALLLVAVSTSAVAGPFNDKMAVCLVKSTTEADRTVLMRWIFSAMASHPDVKDLASMSKAQGEKNSKDVANLVVSLLSERCAAETRDAIKYEGPGAIGSSFEVLGKVAMQGLMSDPEVAKYISSIAANLDAKALKSLVQEPAPAAKP
jgi:hypothetical protein